MMPTMIWLADTFPPVLDSFAPVAGTWPPVRVPSSASYQWDDRIGIPLGWVCLLWVSRLADTFQSLST